MKKKIAALVLRVLSAVLIVGLVVALLLKASQTAELDVAQKEEKRPISFTANVGQTDELQLVSENDRYALYANLCDPTIRLVRKSDGAAVDSRPAGMEEMPDLKKAVQLTLSSLLNIRYADRDSNITEVNSMAGSVSRKNFAATTIAGGVRYDFYFANEGFLVPLELTLTEDGLQASVPLEDIQEASDSVKLTEILPLPNFGAGPVGSGGYAVVPDGSGALIPYEYGLSDYSQRLYGEDAAVGQTVGTAPTQTARLPVFGFTGPSSATIGIITAGDARARVAAKSATTRSPFTTVSAEFIYRERLLIDVGNRTFESTQANMFEPAHCALERFTVEYRMAAQPDYVGMANTYRDYLMTEKQMTATADSSALQLQVIGGVMHEESILGIPVDRVLPVTAYADVQAMVEAFAKQGVTDLTMDYLYWAKAGTEHRLTVDMKAETRLGGKKDLRQLLSQLPDGVKLYFDLNVTDLMHNQSGYSTLYSTAQNVKKEPLTRQQFYLSTYRVRTDAAKVFLLNPLELPALLERWSGKADRWLADGMTGFSANGLAGEIYSHFGDDPIDRGSAQALWESSLQSIADKAENGLLLSAANAYALPYASVVQSVPTEHSRFYCERRAIPFYAIALHGLVDMSVAPINGGEGNQRLLQAVEGGLSLCYALGWQNTDQLKNTAGEQYNYISAADWLEPAATQQKALQAYVAAVSGQAITAHIELAAGVYRTEFANGVWAIVNYTATAVTAGETTVPAEGYVTGGY
ncbi:MAG: hypothetical protein IK954_05725 [Clostridia bacterium]|nr:hypothetical protein [Clostridia bacterium]